MSKYIDDIVDASEADLQPLLIDEKYTRIMAPIPLPKRNIFCVGKNYLDHVNEIAKVGGLSQQQTGSAPSTAPGNTIPNTVQAHS